MACEVTCLSVTSSIRPMYTPRKRYTKVISPNGVAQGIIEYSKVYSGLYHEDVVKLHLPSILSNTTKLICLVVAHSYKSHSNFISVSAFHSLMIQTFKQSNQLRN